MEGGGRRGHIDTPPLLPPSEAFLESLSVVHGYWHGDSKDIQASKFENTFCAFLTIEHELDSLNNLGVAVKDSEGPFSSCPICAPGPGGKEGAGCKEVGGWANLCAFVFVEDDKEFKRSVDLDAVTKANHFKNCAAATKSIPPNLHCNFNIAEAEIRELEDQGRLNLKDYCDNDDCCGQVARHCQATG